MSTLEELTELEKKINQLKRENARLFATNIEIRINQLLIQDRLEEIRTRNMLMMGARGT